MAKVKVTYVTLDKEAKSKITSEKSLSSTIRKLEESGSSILDVKYTRKNSKNKNSFLSF